MYRSKSSFGGGAVRIGGFDRKSLSCVNALSASSVHLNLFCRLRSLKKGSPCSPSLEINRLRAAMQPVSFCTSLMLAGACMFVMADIFSGLASMPRWLMMNPSSLPEGTPKTHLVWLSFHRKARKLEKVSSKSVIRSWHNSVEG